MTFFSLADLGLASSPGQLLTDWLAQMQANYPGYTPSASNLEYILAVIFASWAADINSQASAGASELFTQFGRQLIGIAPETGSSATAIVTIAAVDDQGYTLPVGTQFLLDNQFGFQSTQTLIIPQGSIFGSVTIAAVAAGTDSNSAGASFGAQLNQQLNWVMSTTLAAPAGGGVDPETAEAYLFRLAQELRLLAPRPITATDYGTFTLNFQPVAGTDQETVGRATAVDGYDPNTNTYNNEREVTVCVTDGSGNALNTDTMNAIQAWLRTLREVNFIVNVVAPNYTPVYVACQIVRNTAYDAETVQALVQASLTNFIDPSRWGQAPGGGASTWVNQPTVYYSQLEAVVQNTAGVDHVVQGTLGIGFNTNPNGTSDLLLPGPFPLPTTSGGTTVPLNAITVVN